MLRRTQRLNLKKSYRWVRDGKKLEGNLVKLYIRTGENELSPRSKDRRLEFLSYDNEPARVGVAVSKASFAGAVNRNQAKRKVFSSFQNLYRRLPKGINIVATPKSGVLDVSQEELDKEIEGLLKI